MSNPGKKEYGPAGHRKRLRDRFSKSGRSGLADYELLELLLTYSIPRIDTKPIAVQTTIHGAKMGVKLGDTFWGICTLMNPLDWR